MIGYEFLENPLTMLTGLYHVIGDVLVRPSSVLTEWSILVLVVLVPS